MLEVPSKGNLSLCYCVPRDADVAAWLERGGAASLREVAAIVALPSLLDRAHELEAEARAALEAATAGASEAGAIEAGAAAGAAAVDSAQARVDAVDAASVVRVLVSAEFSSAPPEDAARAAEWERTQAAGGGEGTLHSIISLYQDYYKRLNVPVITLCCRWWRSSRRC